MFIGKVEEISWLVEKLIRENSGERIRKLKEEFKRSRVQERRQNKKLSYYYQNNLRKCPN